MSTFVAFPLIIALAATISGFALATHLNPKTAARCGAVLLGSLLVAAVPTVWVIGLSGLAHTGLRNPVVDWSFHLLPANEPFGTIIGVLSLLAAIIGTVRVVRVLRLHARIRCTDTSPLQFIESTDIFAYTLPGPARTVAVSTALRKSLSENEFAVVLAHERTHARHRHDRMLLLSVLTKAFIPPTTPLTTRFEYFLERWADEEALRVTGIERVVAARTIAKVALAAGTPPLALGIAGHTTVARVEALLKPAQDARLPIRLGTIAVAATTVALAASQLHHTIVFSSDLL